MSQSEIRSEASRHGWQTRRRNQEHERLRIEHIKCTKRHNKTMREFMEKVAPVIIMLCEREMKKSTQLSTSLN